MGAAVIVPFLVLLSASLVWRRPLWQSAGLAFVVALAFWLRVPDVALLGPVIRAGILACEVGLILLGAITFLDAMTAMGATERIKAALAGFTGGNLALEALLLAWLLCGFLEGAAGFGAPAALLAPLLVNLGFSPLVAAVLPLIGDSAAVPFGAVGTPVRVGLGSLGSDSAGLFAAGVNLLAGLVPPLAILLLVGRKDSQARVGPGLALWAGFCFTGPAFLVAWIGPEFPSLVGSLLGLALFCWTLHRRQVVAREPLRRAMCRLLSAFAPYGLVCAFLLLGKLVLADWRYELQLGPVVQYLSAFQPGVVFLWALLLMALWRRDQSPQRLLGFLWGAARRLPTVGLAIFCLASLAQLIVANAPEAESLDWPGGASGGLALILLAPLLGAAAAFVAGSATVASLLTGPFLAQSSGVFGVEPGLVLGLQLVGAAAGNMVSLQNLAAVALTVGLVDQEREMLSLLWKPCAAYLAVATVLGGLLWLTMP